MRIHLEKNSHGQTRSTVAETCMRITMSRIQFNETSSFGLEFTLMRNLPGPVLNDWQWLIQVGVNQTKISEEFLHHLRELLLRSCLNDCTHQRPVVSGIQIFATFMNDIGLIVNIFSLNIVKRPTKSSNIVYW